MHKDNDQKVISKNYVIKNMIGSNLKKEGQGDRSMQIKSVGLHQYEDQN